LLVYLLDYNEDALPKKRKFSIHVIYINVFGEGDH